MSVYSTIDVRLANTSVESWRICEAFRCGGWNPLFDDQIMYLPLGDDDEFDWKSVSQSEESLVKKELKEKSEAGETLGIVFVWQDSQCGGEFLIFPNGKISVNLSVNRRRIARCNRSTDVSWYVERIMTSLENTPLQVESISWQEHY